ncbi:hypothetical protein, partial [Mycobacterium nebraskense]
MLGEQVFCGDYVAHDVLMYHEDCVGVSSSQLAVVAPVSWYKVIMYVTRVPNRGSPPAVLLRESYREDG